MFRAEDIRTVAVTVTAVAAQVGTAVPLDHRRYILGIRATNIFNGANLLSFGKREDGAGASTIIEYIQMALLYDIWKHPDQLPREDSLPLYVIDKTDTDASAIWCVTDNGSAYLVVTYVDAP